MNCFSRAIFCPAYGPNDAAIKMLLLTAAKEVILVPALITSQRDNKMVHNQRWGKATSYAVQKMLSFFAKKGPTHFRTTVLGYPLLNKILGEI